MSILQKTKVATQWMIEIANNNSHGYSQSNRWGPSYDCSSLVIQAWEMAGVPVKSQGASYTGNMYSIFLSNGFKDVTSSVNLNTGTGLEYGDICLNHASHVIAYIGEGQIVHARSSEGTSDTIDNSGNEIRTQSYWNFPWNCVLRYAGDNEISSESSSEETESEEVTFKVDSASKVSSEIQVGDLVEVIGDEYYNGVGVPLWVKNKNWYVYSINGDRAVINESEDHKIRIMSPINISNIQKVGTESTSETSSTSATATTEETTNKSYTVKRGDSLWAIAQKELGSGTRYPEIKSLNNLTSDVIYPGQVLLIP